MTYEKSYKDYVRTNDFEGAKQRYESCCKRWKDHWWNCLVEIYQKCKYVANKYILDFAQKIVKELALNCPKNNDSEENGLYLVGNTYFNPFTDEKFYWYKVGKGSNLTKRMRQYATHNPMLWKQGFLIVNGETKTKELESHCHNILRNVSIGTGEHTKEWFQVTRETYLEISKKGFSYFGLA